MPTRKCSRAHFIRALDEIQKHRERIRLANELAPAAFDEWYENALRWAGTIAGTIEVDELSLHIMQRWIESLPELAAARSALVSAIDAGAGAAAGVNPPSMH